LNGLKVKKPHAIKAKLTSQMLEDDVELPSSVDWNANGKVSTP
jgi:C1A family cysteine protease